MGFNSQPIINYNRCTKCGLCVNGCPEDALIMTNQGPLLKQPIRCTYCTDCEALCPTGAIRTPFSISWGTDQSFINQFSG